ncbi:hypothetical protein UFOVP36_19 [uncultured Caudovirales phage]|uniref:Uncharacterized protein n=1 Tax=uncultured Caudovirales phage TaxID=2100421 RepID=A0A6J5KLH9_9CAUD|nr:hypothetical protein UFOVP36_19 [uncultured Caudovirales phage]
MTADEARARVRSAQEKQQSAFRQLRRWQTERAQERYRLANITTAQAVRALIEASKAEGKEVEL